MDPRTAATRVPDPDAVEFIRFCYRRRRVGWPELYDEMCAVAGRGLYRGMSTDDLAAVGIGFSLFDMPALAALSSQVVAQEMAARRPVTVTIAPVVEDPLDVAAHGMVEVAQATEVEELVPPAAAQAEPAASPPPVRFVPAAATA